MTTYTTKSKDIKRNWYLVDADGKTLGRLASRIAQLLKGKNKTIYSSYLDCGDYVIVVNASKIILKGKKSQQKTYYYHTGYPGGLKSIKFEKMLLKHPERVIYNAVKGMLPHNRLGRKMLKKLFIYADSTHPHSAQQPISIDIEKGLMCN